ncbi:hypothetical protein [Pelomonas sp. SE-A7]|uniref:hypothetical protein n=1 Tax=Pelomonas sp. SE-A7 TaxID=3054953 RepID=UPI00259CD4EE|nr:hypothetical protein [Pelomonas sp. SE-A7]MDM4764981.1 hypothetical protein [Pelomonas sp. SE-A7]
MQITTLIPAYKTKYMVELMTSLVTQTHKPGRIIVSDDSPNGEFGEILSSPAMAVARERLPIEIHRGPQAGAYENFLHLLKLWDSSTELVHLLLDDDVIYPDFYATHRAVHGAGAFSCSISARWTSNERGQPIEGMPIPAGIVQSMSRIVSLDAGAMFTTTIPQCQNWFGEFSNCVMNPRSAALLFKPDFGGVSYAGLWDLGAFLAASLQGPVAYVQDRLGHFRTGGEGHSNQLYGKHMKAAHLGYAALAVGARRIGQLGEAHARQCYDGIALAVQQRYAAEPDMQPLLPVLIRMRDGVPGAEDEFLPVWQDFLSLHKF